MKPIQAPLADPALLDKIDQLFACSVGEYINLPQLVVVGDQSSGKSSVLEGLTKLPFPRDSGLCTRFATQIIFRRSKVQKGRRITASIIPGPNASPEQAEKLREFMITQDGNMPPEEFSRNMKAVHRLMGLSPSDNPTRSTFSNDIFRLEICGPSEDHLTVIDVPGIFMNTTPGKTTRKDMEMVKDMVHGYMKNPRSIMLTVVPANVDIATQQIIEMARQVDPDGDRTLGVLTKPDLVDSGAEQKVIDLVNGQDMILKHGWIMVRNLSQRELLDGNADRDTQEKEWGSKEPWDKIPRDRFGIASLTARLREAVTDNARRAFPLVRAEILNKLRKSKDDLHRMGGERETSEQQANYLLNIISRFQEIANQALNAHYGADEVFDNYPELRLATLATTRNTNFAEELVRWGHEYRFKEETKEALDEGCVEVQGEPIQSQHSVETRKTSNVPALTTMVPESPLEEAPSNSDIHQWLNQVYNASRGFEIGTFNARLLSTIMKKQSQKWNNFARGYVGDIIVYVDQFIRKALELACNDKRVFEQLIAISFNCLVDKYQSALDHVEFLLEVERDGILMTMNQYFNESLQKSREDQIQALLKPKTFRLNGYEEVVRVSDVQLRHSSSNTEQTIRDMHDILQAYYNVAVRRFIDNVCMQGGNHFLLNGPDSPLKFLSSSFVSSLSPEKLKEIAGEAPTTQRKRIGLKKMIKDLEAGKRILL
ncbi:vacuolar sorting protein VPS1, dynamin [Aspergillus steynii IBT 23096]|uniref:Vacuolar sorting protein VPS1, dynamin n=1 Tax=Aspergillus steynii IBT 23096 TaxID=1392250 RepID=A0A2I2GAK6_9EURO|nr:vacuolar sorting protein VPS1, dynamin [Aspergillus steynii IBT 23096]PLB49900.1 vacuolar sorting protein VPS1, dynamin [Aspergillus steynii IBT 23096]